jgi:hypothetical protein
MNNLRKLLLLAAPALLAGQVALAKEGPDQYSNGAENFMAAPCRLPATTSLTTSVTTRATTATTMATKCRA